MKNVHCVVVGVLLLGMSGYADSATANWQQTCKSFSSLGKTIMEARQNGVPMSKQIDIAGDSQTAQKLIIEAYQHSRYETEEIKQQEVSDFADHVYLECVQAIGPK